MPGDHITALKLEGADGEVTGGLNVNFAISDFVFTTTEDAPLPHLMALVGHEPEQQEYSLQSLSDGSL